jgi:hypothetical protein
LSRGCTPARSSAQAGAVTSFVAAH